MGNLSRSRESDCMESSLRVVSAGLVRQYIHAGLAPLTGLERDFQPDRGENAGYALSCERRANHFIRARSKKNRINGSERAALSGEAERAGMNRSIVGAFVVLAILVAGTSESRAYEVHNVLQTRFVGFQYSKLPKDVKYLGGMVVDSSDGKEYAVSWVEQDDKKANTKTQMLWLEQITHRVKGIAYYKVMAVQNVPRYRRNEVLAMGSCSSGDVSKGGDGRTIAVVVQQDKKILKKVTAAWRADPEHGRFVFPDVKKVQCLNEGGED